MGIGCVADLMVLTSSFTKLDTISVIYMPLPTVYHSATLII